MPSPTAPHFSFPFTLTNTGAATVEQGTTEHIMAQAQVVAYCPLGYRQDRPEFGWPWPDMEVVPIDATPLVDALNRFVPDANATLALAEYLVDGTFEIDVDIAATAGSQEDV